MKAVRLTTAFAVAFGIVLPLPDTRDLVPASWAAEKDAPPGSGDLRQRVEDLAKSASDRFGEIVGGKGEQPKATPLTEGAGTTVGLVEQIHSWTARSSSDYQELMRGLSQPLQFNPVADAAAKLAARRAPQGGSGEWGPETQSFVETAIGWAHHAALQYQTVVRGLLSEPGQTVVAAKGPETAAKQAEDARRLTEILKAAEAKKVEEARVATAKQAEAQKGAGVKKAEDTRIAAAKQAEEARRSEEAQRAAEAQRASEAKKADEARVAAATQTEDARRAEESRRAAEAQRATEAKRAEEARVAAAKQAEEARRVAEAQKAAEAKKAEEVRIAAAKQAEDARRTEEARRTAEAQKAAETKKAEEARVAATKQAENARRAEEQRRVAAGESKRAEAKAPAPERATPASPGKRMAAQQYRERKERTAGKGGASPKVAGMVTRKRAKQTGSAAASQGRRKKPVHGTCRMAGNRVNVPGWYVVKRGDTLWKIAARHYGKGRRYPVIYRANVRRIADPNRIVRCQRIYLPKFRRRSG